MNSVLLPATSALHFSHSISIKNVQRTQNNFELALNYIQSEESEYKSLSSSKLKISICWNELISCSFFLFVFGGGGGALFLSSIILPKNTKSKCLLFHIFVVDVVFVVVFQIFAGAPLFIFFFFFSGVCVCEAYFVRFDILLRLLLTFFSLLYLVLFWYPQFLLAIVYRFIIIISFCVCPV